MGDLTNDMDENAGGFATTRWSAVLSAGAGSRVGRRALTWLCEAYWQPLHDHVRRRGYDQHEAQDLVQGFFARLLEKGDLSADPRRGRFRSYLLGALEHYIANHSDREQAQKRGGGRTHVRLGDPGGIEPVDSRTPEQHFARAWAVAVLERVLARLASEYEGKRQAQFAACKPFLERDVDAGTYASVGTGLGMSEGAVKVAVHRLRSRYRELLRLEVAETIDHAVPGLIEDELRDLLSALRS
jgi:DNA-directed RNA polymerase specialized sigma24 family protein